MENMILITLSAPWSKFSFSPLIWYARSFNNNFTLSGASLVPAMQETQVWSVGQEDPLEQGMATHSSILAQRIPGTEGPGRLVYGITKEAATIQR